MAPNGNFQDISVHDKTHAALGATEEEQDVSRLNRVVVPMPSFTNPNNPLTAAGSINLDLDKHPVEHSTDYGAGVTPGAQVVEKPIDQHGDEVRKAAKQAGRPGRAETAAKSPTVEFPEDREDWQKKHYQAALRQVGLPVSGNTDDLKARYDEYEAQEAEYKEYKASDWIEAAENAETADDLAELRSAYDRSGADFSTAVEAFEERQSDFNSEQ